MRTLVAVDVDAELEDVPRFQLLGSMSLQSFSVDERSVHGLAVCDEDLRRVLVSSRREHGVVARDDRAVDEGVVLRRHQLSLGGVARSTADWESAAQKESEAA